MTNSYAAEMAARQEYVTTAAKALTEHLQTPSVQARFGDTGLQLATLAESAYCPDVTRGGIVELDPALMHSDAQPVIVLQPDEIVERSPRYVSFTPAQQQQERHGPSLHTVAGRMGAMTMSPDMLTVVGRRGNSKARRLTYKIGDHPITDETTWFNLRPLGVLDYRKDAPLKVRMRQLATALGHAAYMISSPSVTFPDQKAFELNEKNWRTAAQDLAGNVMRSYRG